MHTNDNTVYINVEKDFAKYLGGSLKRTSRYSGEEFYETLFSFLKSGYNLNINFGQCLITTSFISSLFGFIGKNNLFWLSQIEVVGLKPRFIHLINEILEYQKGRL